MNVIVKMGKTNIVIGTIEIDDGEFVIDGMPFRTVGAKVGKKSYTVRFMAFCDCEDFLLFLYEIASSENKYFMTKITKESVKKDKFEFILDVNPKKILNTIVKEMRKYSDRNGEYDYAEMFQSFFNKEGVES